ncbi:MAG: hypothetical protein ACYC27_10735 [Armatimonadota bacterium]
MNDQAVNNRRQGFIDRKVSLRVLLILLGIVIITGFVMWALEGLSCRRIIRETVTASSSNMARSIALFGADQVISGDWDSLQDSADSLVRGRPFVYIAILDMGNRSIVHTDRNYQNDKFQRSRYGRNVIESFAPVMRGTRQVGTVWVGLRQDR